MKFKLVETMTTEGVADWAIEHIVETRDGTLLATDVYLPKDVIQASAILVRTPYDKTSRYTALRNEAEYYTSRGYVYVAQDVRGKFNSTGETVPYKFDVDDAYDTAEWIVNQTWSNGKIGLVGASYYGYTVWAGVASGHPAIQAAIPAVTGIDMGDGHIGCRATVEVPAVASMNDAIQIWTDNNGYHAEIDWNSDTPENVIAAARAELGTCIAADHKLESSSSPMARWYNPYGDRHPYYTTNIPVLHWQAWYDPGLCPLGMKDWRHFQATSGLRNLHYLRVDSADHSGFQLADVGRGESAWAYTDDDALQKKIDVECGEMADFFDEHLNGIVPASRRPRARWHLGHVGWQHTDSFPPQSTSRTFYLAASVDNVHRLTEGAVVEPADLEWVHDPTNPVPSSVDLEALWYILAAYPDERDLAGRDDVLTFCTTPLGADLDFAGQPELHLLIGLSSESTYLFVRLQDVYPDGTTRPISFARAVINRKTSGKVVVFLDNNAYRIKAGHRVQVQVMSSDSPHWAVHPGNEENPWSATNRVSTTQTLTVGGVSGARLVLPEVDLDKLG